ARKSSQQHHAHYRPQQNRRHRAATDDRGPRPKALAGDSGRLILSRRKPEQLAPAHGRIRSMNWRASFTAIFIWTCAALLPLKVSAIEPADDGTRLFREKIEPVLKKDCFSCHSAQAKELQGGLRLDTRGGLRSGGDAGPVLVAGKPEKSPLIQAI